MFDAWNNLALLQLHNKSLGALHLISTVVFLQHLQGPAAASLPAVLLHPCCRLPLCVYYAYKTQPRVLRCRTYGGIIRI